jgi:manganese/iron transport system permease protein/iron/zinc/copper transport system permease protein
MSWLFEPFQYEFFRTGLLVAVLAGALCGLLGIYIVLRGMSYIGHGLSHAIFGGAVVSFVMQWNFYVGAGLWGFFTAVLINQTARKTRIGADAAIGVITTASFAVGVALISRYRRFTQSFDAALFGNILGVTQEDALIVAGVTALVAALIFALYRQLLFTTFDNEVAQVHGIRTEWIDTLFSLALAAAIIASMQVLGVTLIAAALVIPAITARLLTDSFHRMVLWSVGLGVACAFFGLYLSYYVDIASGAAIVLVQSGVFAVVLAWESLRKKAARRLVHVHID